MEHLTSGAVARLMSGSDDSGSFQPCVQVVGEHRGGNREGWRKGGVYRMKMSPGSASARGRRQRARDRR